MNALPASFHRSFWFVLLIAAMAAGCTTAPTDTGIPEAAPPVEAERPQPAPEAPSAPAEAPREPAAPEPPEPVAKPAPQENIAVARLMRNAEKDSEAGRLANAAATLERALRIEPRNPRLWHELARVRLKQGEYAQAATLAARSNSWAGADASLREANQRLIEEARIARGK
jgi:tetratricopeptide (TPR) repeat protein